MAEDAMRDCTTELCVAELRSEVANERIYPDAFDGLRVAMESVELAASLGITQVLPVGGFVAGAGEARLFNEGFEQQRAIRVASVPVFGQASTDQREGARGEVTTGYPRQDEEARVVDDQMQVSLALLAAPADGVIARLSFPGARAEAEHGDDFPCSAHEVAQLRTGQGLMSEVVMALDVGVPQQGVALLDDQIDGDRGQVHARGDQGRQHGSLDLGMPLIGDGLGFAWRGQSEERVGLHLEQGHP